MIPLLVLLKALKDNAPTVGIVIASIVFAVTYGFVEVARINSEETKYTMWMDYKSKKLEVVRELVDIIKSSIAADMKRENATTIAQELHKTQLKYCILEDKCYTDSTREISSNWKLPELEEYLKD